MSGVPYQRIQAPENLRKNRWILKTFGTITVFILLAFAAFTFVRVTQPRCRARVTGQYLECGGDRLFLCGTALREDVLLLAAIAKEIGENSASNRPYPRVPPSAELIKFIDESALAFELKCQQITNSGGNLLQWELEIPFDPELVIDSLQLMGVRSLLNIAQKYDIFVVLSLTSSSSMNDFAKDGLAYSDIDRYIASVIVPMARALKGHPSLLAISPMDTADDLLDYVDLDDVCTDLSVLDGSLLQNKWNGGLTIRMVQYFVAKVAEVVHTVDPEELVTVVSSSLVSIKPVGYPGFFSDMCLEKACVGCDSSKANVDFYMPASFGIGNGNLMPSVPFMTKLDKPIILAFNPAEELDLLIEDVDALPKTLKEIGFSGFFFQPGTQVSLAGDIRVNDKAGKTDIETLEDVELLEAELSPKAEEDFGDLIDTSDIFVQEIEAADGRKFIVEGEPRDEAYGPMQPIITGESLMETAELQEEDKEAVVKPEPREVYVGGEVNDEALDLRKEVEAMFNAILVEEAFANASAEADVEGEIKEDDIEPSKEEIAEVKGEQYDQEVSINYEVEEINEDGKQAVEKLEEKIKEDQIESAEVSKEGKSISEVKVETEKLQDAEDTDNSYEDEEDIAEVRVIDDVALLQSVTNEELNQLT